MCVSIKFVKKKKKLFLNDEYVFSMSMLSTHIYVCVKCQHCELTFSMKKNVTISTTSTSKQNKQTNIDDAKTYTTHTHQQQQHWLIWARNRGTREKKKTPVKWLMILFFFSSLYISAVLISSSLVRLFSM